MATLSQDLLNAVYTCVSEFHESYSQIIDTPRERWASMMDDAFSLLLSHHMEILRLGQIVAESTDTLSYPVIPETFTKAINAGSNVHLKSQRHEAFQEICQQITKQTKETSWKEMRSLTYTFTEEDLRELSYLIPGQHGWILVCPDSNFQRFLDGADRFCVELQLPGSMEIAYGEYKTRAMPGQAMSGLEFAQLSVKTRNNIANSIYTSREEMKDSSEFRKIMEDLLHSRITLSCVFLECVEAPTQVHRTLTPSPTSGVINDIRPIYPMQTPMLPVRDPILDLAPRLIRTESDGFELIDDALINFPSIARRRHPFGVIGDSRLGYSTITTSTPNLSEKELQLEADAEAAGTPTPLALSFSLSVDEEGRSNGMNASFSGPLRPIQMNGQFSSPFERVPSLASSLPLPLKRGGNNSISSEYSFTNDQNSHPDRFSLGMLSYHDYDYTHDDQNEHDFLNINHEQENRPSSALASIVSGREPIWGSCRLRKMSSAPSIPREIEIQNANANGNVISGNGEKEREGSKLFW